MAIDIPDGARDRLRTTAFVLFILIGTVFILVQWRGILVPIAISVVVWYIIVALTGAFARLSLGGSRLSPLICRACAIVCVFLAGGIFVALMRQSVRALLEAAPRYEERVDTIIREAGSWLGIGDAPTFAQIAQDIDLNAVAEYFMSSATSVLFDMIMILFYTVFLLIQQGSMPRKLAAIVPDQEKRRKVEDIIDQIHREVQKYIGVMSFLALVTGVITYAVLRLVGVDFAVLWAVMCGLISFIPTVGTALGIALPSVIALLQFGLSSEFLIVLPALFVAQILLNNVAQPALMGKSLNLSPFIILVALSVWGTIWGIVGAVLSIPITVAMAIIFSYIPSTRWVSVILSSRGSMERTA